LKLAKALDMLPRTPLFTLLATSLLAAPSFEPPQLPALSSSEQIQNAASFGWPQNSNDEKYTLRGTVVNSLTGEPIRGALVQIYLIGQASMLTGPDGKFQFDGLPAGQTTIAVRKPGFFTEEEIQPSGGGQRLATTGANPSPIVLKLIPEGVIHGKISEDDGEPIEGLPIQLLAQRLQNGRKVWEERTGTTTDEEGMFRIAELHPGNYFLSAGPSRAPVTFPSKLSQSGAQGIPVTFYPSGSDLAAAAPIPITPGKRFEVNLSLSPRPFYRVSGMIAGYGQGQYVNLQVLDSTGKSVANNSRFDAASGSFQILWIPAGAYALRADSPGAQGQALTATIPLTVNSDLSGIHIMLMPTVSIPIRMRFIASRTGSERLSEQENWSPAYVQLVSRNNGLTEFQYGAQQVGERGNSSLQLQNIAPGTYEVEINPNGMFYVQSVTSGTTNLLESHLSVAPGGSVQPIEIVMRDDAASLSGNVSSVSQPLNATVMAIPERSSAQPILQLTDSNGNFQFAFLPPGAYKILAIDHPEQLEYSNPDVLRKYLSKARETTLSADQAARIDLELVKVGE
jgi:Carboxypeptidase regulatory-like domain